MENKYMAAFHYMVGTITTREQLNLSPLPAKELLQRVYDSYGIFPVGSICSQLDLKIDQVELDNDETHTFI